MLPLLRLRFVFLKPPACVAVTKRLQHFQLFIPEKKKRMFKIPIIVTFIDNPISFYSCWSHLIFKDYISLQFKLLAHTCCYPAEDSLTPSSLDTWVFDLDLPSVLFDIFGNNLGFKGEKKFSLCRNPRSVMLYFLSLPSPICLHLPHLLQLVTSFIYQKDFWQPPV